MDVIRTKSSDVETIIIVCYIWVIDQRDVVVIRTLGWVFSRLYTSDIIIMGDVQVIYPMSFSCKIVSRFPSVLRLLSGSERGYCAVVFIARSGTYDGTFM